MMSIRRHMAAFAATRELIGAQVDSFRENPPQGDDFETNDDDGLGGMGIVYSAVSTSLRQMKSDLHALNRAQHHLVSHPHHHDHDGHARKSETADEQ